MDSKTRAAFRRQLDAQIAQRVPTFDHWKDKSIYLWPGERAYARHEGGDIWSFIVFSPHEQHPNEFTVELGWSKLGRFPEISMRPSALEPNEQHEEFREDEYMTRLGILLGANDRWWRLPKGGDSKAVMAVIGEVIDSLIASGLPYLNSFSKTVMGDR